jgi:hypothetical protein
MYEISGPEIVSIGVGDWHDRHIYHLAMNTYFAEFLLDCLTQAFEDTYITNQEAIYTSAVVFAIVLTTLAFVDYDSVWSEDDNIRSWSQPPGSRREDSIPAIQ